METLETRAKPRYQQLEDRLRKLVQDSPAGTRLPSYATMMRRYKVGQVTIDRAMRALDAEGLVVRQHGRGVFVSERAKERTVGLVFGRNIFSSFVSPVYRHLMGEAATLGISRRLHVSFFLDLPTYHVSEHDVFVHRDLYEALRNHRLQGVIAACPRGPREIRFLMSFGIPVVVFSTAALGAPRVGLDYRALMRLGVEALAVRSCRRIGLITLGGSLRASGAREDLEFFTEAMRAAGLSADSSLVWDEHPEPSESAEDATRSNEDYGREATEALLRRHGWSPGRPLPFDALISTDDMATRGVLAALRSRGLETGRDLLIATHANKGSTALPEDAELIRIEFDPKEFADRALDLLGALMDGRADSAQVVRVSPRLILPGTENAALQVPSN